MAPNTDHPRTLRLKVEPRQPPRAQPVAPAPAPAQGGTRPKRVRIRRAAGPKPRRQGGPLYRNLLNSIYDAALVTDEQGRIIDVNLRAAEFFNHTAEELCRLTVADVIAGADDSLLQTIRGNRERFALLEADCLRRGERGFPAEIAVSRLAFGPRKALVFLVRNVALRREAQAALQRSHDELEQRVAERTAELAESYSRLQGEMRKLEKAKAHEKELVDRLGRAERTEALGVLAGGVAHDLNNTLNPIEALPAMIADRLRQSPAAAAPDLKDVFQDLSIIETSARIAVETIRDLMTLGRRGDFERVPVDVNRVIRDCIEMPDIKALHEAAPSIHLELRLTEPIPAVLGSAPHLSRAVANIVRNGFEALGQVGLLSLGTGIAEPDVPVLGHELIPPGRYVVLRIADDGPGMAPEDERRIFDPFFTRKPQSRQSGSGLGLSIVHRVVKDHDGFIDLQSTPGKGTAFDLYLPAAPDE